MSKFIKVLKSTHFQNSEFTTIQVLHPPCIPLDVVVEFAQRSVVVDAVILLAVSISWPRTDIDIEFLTENGDLPLIKAGTNFLFLTVSNQSLPLSVQPLSCCFDIFVDQSLIQSFFSPKGGLPPLLPPKRVLLAAGTQFFLCSLILSPLILDAPASTPETKHPLPRTQRCYILKDGVTAGSITVQETQTGTREDVECAAHGICLEEEGVCDCFVGYQSSDGAGGIGERGDCGWRNTYQTALFSGDGIADDYN